MENPLFVFSVFVSNQILSVFVAFLVTRFESAGFKSKEKKEQKKKELKEGRARKREGGDGEQQQRGQRERAQGRDAGLED